jgi:hypothetical protein
MELPTRKLSWPYILQMTSRKNLLALMEAIMELTLSQCALQIWVLTAEITDGLILELDNILCAHDTSVDLKHHLLKPDEEVPPTQQPSTTYYRHDVEEKWQHGLRTP